MRIRLMLVLLFAASESLAVSQNGLAREQETPRDAVDVMLRGGRVVRERNEWRRLPSGVRLVVNSTPSEANSPSETTRKEERQRAPGEPAKANSPAPTGRTLVVYATPNGNSIEQTLGCESAPGLDWHFGIQHVAAQIRHVRHARAAMVVRQIVLAVVESPKLSWPTFVRERSDSGKIIRELVDELAKQHRADEIVLMAHSGGGAFLLRLIDEHANLPAAYRSFVFLDANYAFNGEKRHGEKLADWLKHDDRRSLIVIAYDDREIRLNDKPVVGPTGGTFRATEQMLVDLKPRLELKQLESGDWTTHSALDGRLQSHVHRNPMNKILHTALVGEMNGVVFALTSHLARGGPMSQDASASRTGATRTDASPKDATPTGANRSDGLAPPSGPPCYGEWIQKLAIVEPPRATLAPSAPPVRLSLPARRESAVSGSQFAMQASKFDRNQFETAAVRELVAGNIPDHLRTLTPVEVKFRGAAGGERRAVFYVTPDYLAVGDATDSFRVPLSPSAVLQVADAANCTLLTAKLSDDVFAAAQVKLKPQPLTEAREAVGTFFQHHELIERQWSERRASEPQFATSGGGLVAGVKKDLVWTKRLLEKPRRAAIYGWHRPEGGPIQPLYVGHAATYVDYSHGARLLYGRVRIDGEWHETADVLRDRDLCETLSDEGPIDIAELRKASER